jgi:hypothetical protein
LEVVVADDPTGDPGRACTGLGLLEEDDILARPEAARAQFPREVVRGRQSVDAAAYDDEG